MPGSSGIRRTQAQRRQRVGHPKRPSPLALMHTSNRNVEDDGSEQRRKRNAQLSRSAIVGRALAGPNRAPSGIGRCLLCSNHDVFLRLHHNGKKTLNLRELMAGPTFCAIR